MKLRHSICQKCKYPNRPVLVIPQARITADYPPEKCCRCGTVTTDGLKTWKRALKVE